MDSDLLIAICLYKLGFMEGYLKGLMDDESGDEIDKEIMDDCCD